MILPSGSERKTITGIWSGMNFWVKFNIKIGVGGVEVCSSFLQEERPQRRNMRAANKNNFGFIGYWTGLISCIALDFFDRLKSFERLIAKEYLGVICVPL
jgi:hypothetical protein